MSKTLLKKKLSANIFKWLVRFFGNILAILIGLYTLLKVVLYLSQDYNSPFLKTKAAFFDGIYQYGFYAHIFSAPLVLFLGLACINVKLRKNHLVLHKNLGKAYVFLILFLAAPGGLIMGLHAFGGMASILSFIFLVPLWWFYTYKAYIFGKKGNTEKHKIYMQRSFLLTLSAVFLRIYGFVFKQWAFFDLETSYIIISWMSWLPNILIFEYWHFKEQKKKFLKPNELFTKKLDNT